MTRITRICSRYITYIGYNIVCILSFIIINNLMRRGILLMYVIIAACGNKPKLITNPRQVTIQLVDSLGKVSFNIPARYDTFVTWTHYSDCGERCDRCKYRWQLKKLPLIKESGWYWTNEPIDSIDRFTIIHSGYMPFYEGNSQKIRTLHKFAIHRLNEDVFHSAHVIFDTIERVNDRLFSIAVADSINLTTQMLVKKVSATTTIKSNEITFLFEMVTRKKDTVNFIADALKCIRTIKLEKGI